jgi:outer membrane protein assembly factor BamB
MKPHRIGGKYFRVVLSVIALCPAFCRAQDWPQWRGSNRDGIVVGFSEPKTWPERLVKKWEATVGIGHSSPVVVGPKVYLFARQKEDEVIFCLDLDTGKVLWRDQYAVPYQMNPAATKHGKGPKSTPVVRNGRVYTLGITGILSCYDALSGKLRWRKDFASQFSSTSPYFGTAMSPVIDGGLLIAHVGGHDSGALTAFDAQTGEPRWSWKGDGPGYASPLVVELGGVRQVVTQSQKQLIGVSATDGALLWSIPFTTPYVQNIVTPIIYKETLIFSGLNKGVMAIRLIRKGSAWTTEKVWENSEISFYMSTPVLHENLLLGMSNRTKGQFVCLDARTGAQIWAGDSRQGENAAIVKGGEKLFSLTTDAELIVSRITSNGLEPLKRYTVAGSPTWAHPVIVGNRVLIKDESTLALWSF